MEGDKEIRPKWAGGTYQGPKKRFYPSKSTEIKEAVDRKEKSIATYTDKKEAGIVISGAIRDAFLWCVNHPEWGSEMTEEERRNWIDHITKENIRFVASNRSDYESYYNQLRNASDEIAIKSKEEADVSAIETIDDPDTDFGQVSFDL